jgi:hypothetical protein
LGAALGVAACVTAPSVFTCAGKSCGPDGVCEPDGFCANVDPGCPSGYRYDRTAGDGKAGTCVGGAGLEASIADMPVGRDSVSNDSAGAQDGAFSVDRAPMGDGPVADGASAMDVAVVADSSVKGDRVPRVDSAVTQPDQTITIAPDMCPASGCVTDRRWPQWHMPDSPTVFCSDGTNPITCPAGGTQDGNIRVDVPTYDTSVIGIATDSVTGLHWQADQSAVALTWTMAASYCTGLRVGGFTDWRLPTRVELASLVDYGADTSKGPAIDKAAFPLTQVTSYYWTASVFPGTPTTLAWFVDFRNGYVQWQTLGTAAYVRCVR